MGKIIVKDYNSYIDGYTKSELINILKTFNISFSKSSNKTILVKLIIDNKEVIVKQSLELFQNDELHYLKYVLKYKGILVNKLNPLLINFVNVLKRNGLMFEIDNNIFIMPKEIYTIYKKEIKKKDVIKTIQNNTREYNLILGYIDAYGILEFNNFYSRYSLDYKLTNQDTKERIIKLAMFFKEFQIIDADRTYIASVDYKFSKKKSSALKDNAYAIYTNNEILDIHSLKYIENTKSYKKIIKCLKSNYYMETINYTIFKRCILKPFLELNQINKDAANVLLPSLIEEYFEIRDKRIKKQLIELILDVSTYYPRWELNGSIERDTI